MDRAMASHGAEAERALAAVLVVVALAACGGPASVSGTASPASGLPEHPSLRIGVAGLSDAAYQPLVQADQLGYFRAEDLTVDLQDLKGDAQALAAVTAGSVDIAAGLYENTIRAQAQGRALEMIAVFDLGPGLVVLVNAKHLDARSVRDLANLRIGVVTAGSASEELVKYLFKSSGLDPASAQTVAVGSAGPAMAALRSDQIQALATIEATASALEQTGDGKPLYDTRTLQGTRDVFGGTWPGAGLYLATDFVRQNPHTVAALARAVVKAMRHSRSEAGLYSTDGMMPADGPGTVLQTVKVADAKTDWSTIDLKKTYDNSFVRVAAGGR